MREKTPLDKYVPVRREVVEALSSSLVSVPPESSSYHESTVHTACDVTEDERPQHRKAVLGTSECKQSSHGVGSSDFYTKGKHATQEVYLWGEEWKLIRNARIPEALNYELASLG